VPGDSVAGLKVQKACDGRLPQASVIGPAKAPPCAVAVTVYVAVSPPATVAAVGETFNVKFVTVMRTS
jgi:hypothetical protein